MIITISWSYSNLILFSIIISLLERKANFMEEESYTVPIGFVLTKSFSLPTLLLISLLNGALSARKLTCWSL